ncbi:putative nuclease HARBI1 isoform X1 [Ornithodoros turicata]|uniref:putative nuclease HARBI1 isoform X1 n=1 Tax=Ornithodoros turicata TaxID=34597 RepID=UPI00313A4577
MAEVYAFFEDVGVREDEITRVFRSNSDAFTVLSDDAFIRHFRLSKEAVREVCDAVREDLKRPQQWRSTTLTVEQRVLMALRFYGTGAFLGNIAHEEYFTTTKGPVSESLHAVSLAVIKHLAPKYLRFPQTPEEKLAVKRGFYDVAGLPGCLGAVDGTAVAIIAPSTKDPRFTDGNYYSHKGYHALNVLGICDANRRILHLNARYPGSCHDAAVWSMCRIRQRASVLFDDGEWLLGDLGYPLEPWLMTPFRAPASDKEVAYNAAHSRTRVRIEQCFGLLKMRFRCLQRYRTLHFAPDRACNIITACAVLHNMCISYNLPEHAEDPEPAATEHDSATVTVTEDEPSEEGEPISRNDSFISQAMRVRETIVNRYF